MKFITILLVGIAVTGCKKDEKKAPAAKEGAPAATAPAETKPVETAPVDTKPTEAAAPFEATGIPECDAVLESYKKFQACTSIKEED